MENNEYPELDGLNALTRDRMKANAAWEGCDGCDENDKNFWVNGYITGKLRSENRALNELIDWLENEYVNLTSNIDIIRKAKELRDKY